MVDIGEDRGERDENAGDLEETHCGSRFTLGS
jgi:hypothetical protein